MQKAKTGEFVKIHKVILDKGERASNIPQETQDVPLEMWLNGFLETEESVIGEKVTIKTFTGRLVEGELVAINPGYDHTFGEPIPELLQVGIQAREIIRNYISGNGTE